MATSSFNIGDLNSDIAALNSKVMIAPDWSNGVTCCTDNNVAYTAPAHGYIVVSKQFDRGIQLNINNVPVFYDSPTYYGASTAHASWCIPVKQGDQIKLVGDGGVLPTGMSATFYYGKQ